MAVDIRGLERVFKFTHNSKEITLDYPDHDRTPEQVMALYSNQYPELTTATVQGPEFVKDKAVFWFKTTIGLKG